MFIKKQIIINGYKTDYIVTSDGEIYSLKTNKNLSKLYNKGYLQVELYFNNSSKRYYVHRLVAQSFIPNDFNKPEVNHKDGNKNNNNVNNLEWVTKSENIIHAYNNNLKHGVRGRLSHLAKYDDISITTVCELLAEGYLPISEISKLTNVPSSTIYGIIFNNDWSDISKNYNIQNYYKDREYYTHEQYEIIFKLLEENLKSLYEISDISGCRYSSVCNVISRKPNPLYNDLYNKYDISKYNSTRLHYKPLPNALKNDAKNMLMSGIKPKYIKRILSKQYKINEEAIRVYIRDYLK